MDDIKDSGVSDTPAVDAIEETTESLASAAASVDRIVGQTTEDILETTKALIREKPLAAVAVIAGVAYLLGRLRS